MTPLNYALTESERISLRIPRHILNIVIGLRYMPLEMLCRFFPKSIPREDILAGVKKLYGDGLIYHDTKTGIVYDSRFTPMSLTEVEKNNQADIIRAAWVLTKYGLLGLKYFEVQGYPTQIYFKPIDTYPERETGASDVTVITPWNIKTLQTLCPKHWARSVPSGIKNEDFHIAMIPTACVQDKYHDFMLQLKKIGFTFYATLDDETKDVKIKILQSK